MERSVKPDPREAPAALGAGSFGGVGTPKALIGAGLDEPAALDILDRGVELGLTLVETAHSYADGASERIIGRWLTRGSDRRESIAIIDKLGASDRDGEFVLDLSPAALRRVAESSRS